jgi:hypothetical protein
MQKEKSLHQYDEFNFKIKKLKSKPCIMRKIAICLSAFLILAGSGYSQEKTKVKTKTAAKKTVVKAKGATAKSNGVGCSTDEWAFNEKYFTKKDTVPGRGLADWFYLWDKGATLKVKFLSGSPALRTKIFNMAKEWEQYANLRFELAGPNDPAHIRIMLDNKGGHNSAIGTTASQIPDNEKTMNLDTSSFYTEANMHGTVLHEFGHAIGLLHEHYNPLAGIKWNKPVVYEELKRTQNWDEQTIQYNLFQQVAMMYTDGTYDKTSIMHYPVFSRWTTDGFSVDWNNYLSNADKVFVAKLYPFTGDRFKEVPRMVVSEFTSMNIVKDATKNGISLYPSFYITTAGVAGKVYLAAFFYDKDGNPIMDTDDNYNISGVVSTFKGLTFNPNMKLSANKLDPKDFELFIPYSQLPVASGTNVQVVFRPFIYYNDEVKFLYSSKPMMVSIIK